MATEGGVGELINGLMMGTVVNVVIGVILVGGLAVLTTSEVNSKANVGTVYHPWR